MRKILQWTLVLVLVLMGLPVAAQQQFGIEEPIVLEAFASPIFEIQGLRPQGWTENPNTPGIYLRFRDPLDRTGLILQSAPAERAVLEENIVTSFELDAMPESVDTLETDAFTWDLFVLERQQNDLVMLIDLAITEVDGRTYFAMLQTASIFYDALHTDVFLPVVAALEPIEVYTDAEERYSVPVPPAWGLEEADGYQIMTSPTADVTVYVAAVPGDDPATAMQALWQQINPEFELVYVADDVRTIDDVTRLGGLEQVQIVDWLDGTGFEGFVIQGVGRLLDGMVYITLVDSTVVAIRSNESALTIIDRGFRITALEDLLAPPETATEEAE